MYFFINCLISDLDPNSETGQAYTKEGIKVMNLQTVLDNINHLFPLNYNQ